MSITRETIEQAASHRIAELEENLKIAGLRADVAEQSHALKLRRIAELDGDLESARTSLRLADEGSYKLRTRIAELEAIVTECDPALIARREKMHDVSMKYYALLDKLDGATSDELTAIKNHLDELSAPFSENQAFVALLERKRMIKEDSADRIRELTGQNISLRSLIETLKTAG